MSFHPSFLTVHIGFVYMYTLFIEIQLRIIYIHGSLSFYHATCSSLSFGDFRNSMASVHRSPDGEPKARRSHQRWEHRRQFEDNFVLSWRWRPISISWYGEAQELRRRILMLLAQPVLQRRHPLVLGWKRRKDVDAGHLRWRKQRVCLGTTQVFRGWLTPEWHVP